MRNLKVFGVGLFAMLALSAIAASAAFASYDWEDTGANNEASLVGKSTSAQVFKTKFGTIECSAGEFTGTQKAEETKTTPEQAWTVGSVTVHPAYTGCKALGFNATVTSTGCNYVFTTATTTESGTTHALVHLACEAGKKIHIVAAGGLCSVDVGPQESVGTVDFMNEGTGSTRHVNVISTANNISYEGIGGFCSGAGTGGTYEGSVDVTAKTGGTQVGVWVT